LDGVLVNVCGASQSGTTMLHLMLGSARRAFACGEVYAWYRPFDPRHHEPACHCGRSPCPVWEKLSDLPEERFHRGAIDRLRRHTVIDSSKDLDWVTDANGWARESGLRVENVLIWKEPITLAYSWWRRGWLNPGDRSGGTRTLLQPEKLTLYYEKFFESGLPYVSVNYDALIESPGETLQGLSEALGLRYHRKQERFWRKKHHYLFGSGTVSRALKRGERGFVKEEPPEEFKPTAERFEAEVEGSERVQATLRQLVSSSAPRKPQPPRERPPVEAP
jgi:hypothetical protein